jgi:hypothetical protein
MDNPNMPYLNGTKPVAQAPAQVPFANVSNAQAMGAVPTMNHGMFFDNNPQQAGEDGTLQNTFVPSMFAPVEGFTDTGVTHTTNPGPLNSATNPMGNTGQLAQGQTFAPGSPAPTTQYNPSSMG